MVGLFNSNVWDVLIEYSSIKSGWRIQLASPMALSEGARSPLGPRDIIVL